MKDSEWYSVKKVDMVPVMRTVSYSVTCPDCKKRTISEVDDIKQGESFCSHCGIIFKVKD